MRRHHPAGAWRATLCAALLVSGCDHSPSQDILGSFFPAWLLCAGMGVLVTAVCHQLFGLLRLNDSLLMPPLTYLALAAASTVAIWLVWFGN